MKLQLGIAACLLAGCASQPRWGHSSDPAGIPATATSIATARPTTVLRIGVEFLPPELEEREPPIVERTIPRRPERLAETPTTLTERRLVPDARHTWALSSTDFAAIDDPFARETLRFMDDLVREDRRRTEREVRLPFLEQWRPADLELSQPLWSEQAIAEEQAEWVHDNGPRVLSRPARRLLRRFPLVTAFEVQVDDFRSSFVPLSKPYRDAHKKHRKLGRLSMRLHASRRGDPLEVVYINHGVRLGTSQDRGRLSIDWPLLDNLSFNLNSHYEYYTYRTHIRADLSYRYSPTTSVRFAVGDDMNFLSTSSIYSMFEAPMDGSPGLLMYAVHIF